MYAWAVALLAFKNGAQGHAMMHDIVIPNA
jgi:hypothetical protein